MDNQQLPSFEIEDAIRRKSWLRLALVAPSGGGKTATMLRIARGLAESMIERGVVEGPLARKVGVIDTEHKSARLYQDKMFPDGARVMPFNVIELAAPYTTERYKGAAMSFINAGFPIIIVDQLSHAWAGSGGLLEKKEKIAKKQGMDDYRAFAEITPEQNEFIEFWLSREAHVIVSMRAVEKYVMQSYTKKNGDAGVAPTRVGFGPVQRKGTIYEFTTVLNLQTTGNTAVVEKDRTGVFGEPLTELGRLTELHGRKLADFLYSGADLLPEGEEATIEEKFAAVATTWCEYFKQCENLPDLARAFGEAATALNAVGAACEARQFAKERIIYAKDQRKAVLTPQTGAPRDPANKLIGPDEVIELESNARVLGATDELCKEFEVMRLSNLPSEKLFEARNWLDARAVITGKTLNRGAHP